LVMHNKWSVLTNESGEPENEDLETLVGGFSKTLDEVTRQLGIKTQVHNYERHLPRKLREALLKYKKLGKQLARATEKGSSTQLLNEKYKRAQARFKKLMKAHKRIEKQRKYNKISDAFEAHDHKGVWTQIKALTGQATEGDAPQLVQNKEGELQTSLQDILNVQREHYQSIMQHDPENLAMNKEYSLGARGHSPRGYIEVSL